MLHRECEVCGEKFSLWDLDSTDENKHSVMCKCPKCGTQYKAPKISKKKICIIMIPIAIVCVLGYILFDQYFGADFYGRVAIVLVLCISYVIICINHIKNLKLEKLDEGNTGNTNE